MFRIFIASAAVWCAVATAAAQEPQSPQRSRAAVFAVSDSNATIRLEENARVVQRMTDALVLSATGQPDLSRAWRSLIAPQDRIGIKVSTAGGRYLSSHHAVVEALVRGLGEAGIPRKQITIWDRDSLALTSAGFTPERGGCAVRGIDPPRGLDPEAKFIAPLFGKLIWGDLMFRGKPVGLTTTAALDNDQLSAESYLPALMTRDLTKVINVGVLCENVGCGIGGTLYNMTIPAVDNNRRFLREGGTSSIIDLYRDPRMGAKVVLHILDGLVAQYAGGPEFNPNYAFEHRTLYASRDPVALDATGFRLIERWRKQAQLPSLQSRAAWLQEAEVMGLGRAQEGDIDFQNVYVKP